MFSPQYRKLVASSLALSTLLLSGCHRPDRVEAFQERDSSLSCQQIQEQINYAEQAKIAAREHDKFEFRYMLIVPAFISAYNFHKAEQAADERIANMEQLYTANNCSSKMTSSSEIPPMPSYGAAPGMPPMMGMGAGQPNPYGMPGGMPAMPGGMPGDDYPEPFPGGYPPQGMTGR